MCNSFIVHVCIPIYIYIYIYILYFFVSDELDEDELMEELENLDEEFEDVSVFCLKAHDDDDDDVDDKW